MPRSAPGSPSTATTGMMSSAENAMAAPAPRPSGQSRATLPPTMMKANQQAPAKAAAATPTRSSASSPAPAKSQTPAAASATQARSSRRLDPRTAAARGPRNSIVTATPRGMREMAK